MPTDVLYIVDGYEPKTTAVNTGVGAHERCLAFNQCSCTQSISDGLVIQLAHQMGIKSQLKPTYSLALGSL